MANLEKLTDEEKNFLKKHGDDMLDFVGDAKENEHKAFVSKYNELEKQGKDVSEFNNYLKMYEGESLH